MANVYEWLDSGKILIGDGAMGTALQEAGLTDGGAPELWNVDHADRVAKILRAYADAGADFITTNSFGGTKPRLVMHDLGERVYELNKAASEVARKVADESKATFVFGDVGPTGELMDPLGTMTHDEAQAIFAEQIQGLVDGGCDAIIIETMSDLSEVRAAVDACKQVAPDMPIVATMSFDTNLRTMMGVKPSTAIAEIASMGVRLIGANCGRGTDEMRIITQEFVDAKPDGVHILISSNAGLPQLVGDEFVYNGTPEVMSEFVDDMHALGVNAFGACCGSNPTHIAAIAKTLH